jgi:hypothetical protein
MWSVCLAPAPWNVSNTGTFVVTHARDSDQHTPRTHSQITVGSCTRRKDACKAAHLYETSSAGRQSGWLAVLLGALRRRFEFEFCPWLLARWRESTVDSETAEIQEPPNVQAAIERLDEEGRKALTERCRPPLPARGEAGAGSQGRCEVGRGTASEARRWEALMVEIGGKPYLFCERRPVL